MNPHLRARNPVGKTFANWTPSFANWAQLADVCQLESLLNQPLAFSWQLARGNGFANLPTDASPCFYSSFVNSSVGENSPSYYVVEGTDVPSTLRRRVPDCSDASPAPHLVVLAIDLGTTTGWALKPRDGPIAHGFVGFRPQRFEGGGMRYLRFKRWLTELKAVAVDIHVVYFEEVRRHGGVDAAHVYGGLMATLTTWCEHHNVPYQGVPVGTIKKHATGKGNAGKDEVIAAMRAKGHPVTDDNEADALALLHWAIDTQEI
jgi:hypothetical protein